MEVVALVGEAVVGQRVGGPEVGSLAVGVEDLGVELAGCLDTAGRRGVSVVRFVSGSCRWQSYRTLL